MKVRLWALIISTGLSSWGCTKAVPAFSNLDSTQIPQPLVFGQSQYLLSYSVPNQSFLFSGTCDMRTKSLVVREKGTSAWLTLDAAPFVAVGTGIETCRTSGTFSLTVNDMTTLNGGSAPGGPMQKDFEIRSEFEIGPSNISVFTARYSTTIQVKPGQFRVTQGSQNSTGTQFKVNARVGPISGGSATGTLYKVSRETD